ncbi:MAG: hypothetical protein U5R31_11085 [Acidimicrobiia bacterium]|nr:hypothetical protein [Acidimicrobiia bacterium]
MNEARGGVTAALGEAELQRALLPWSNEFLVFVDVDGQIVVATGRGLDRLGYGPTERGGRAHRADGAPRRPSPGRRRRPAGAARPDFREVCARPCAEQGWSLGPRRVPCAVDGRPSRPRAGSGPPTPEGRRPRRRCHPVPRGRALRVV